MGERGADAFGLIFSQTSFNHSRRLLCKRKSKPSTHYVSRLKNICKYILIVFIQR